MENTISNTLETAAPAPAPAPEIQTTVPAATPEPVALTPREPEKPSDSSDVFGNKMELLTIGMLALIASSYIYSIFYYRKAYETSNSVQNIQRQLDQLKLAVKTA